jgi:hypothetical protein
VKLSRRQWGLVAQGGQALLGGIAVGVLVYSAVQIGSAYMRGYEFEKSARKEAALAAASSKTPDTIRQDILDKAQDLGLAVSGDDIRVTSSQKQAEIPIGAVAAIVANGNQNELPTVGAVNIDISYQVPIVFPLHTFRMRFNVHADEHSI